MLVSIIYVSNLDPKKLRAQVSSLCDLANNFLNVKRKRNEGSSSQDTKTGSTPADTNPSIVAAEDSSPKRDLTPTGGDSRPPADEPNPEVIHLDASFEVQPASSPLVVVQSLVATSARLRLRDTPLGQVNQAQGLTILRSTSLASTLLAC